MSSRNVAITEESHLMASQQKIDKKRQSQEKIKQSLAEVQRQIDEVNKEIILLEYNQTHNLKFMECHQMIV